MNQRAIDSSLDHSSYHDFIVSGQKVIWWVRFGVVLRNLRWQWQDLELPFILIVCNCLLFSIHHHGSVYRAAAWNNTSYHATEMLHYNVSFLRCSLAGLLLRSAPVRNVSTRPFSNWQSPALTCKQLSWWCGKGKWLRYVAMVSGEECFAWSSLNLEPSLQRARGPTSWQLPQIRVRSTEMRQTLR